MDPIPGLSNREQDVVDRLLEGKSNKQIALALHITEHTVEFHLKNIYSKYQVSSRTELILKLGDSVVAEKSEDAENGGQSHRPDWFASLRDARSRIIKEFEMASSSASAPRSEGNTMTFSEAILVCFKNYAEFHGRASRPEFWWFALFVTLAATACAYVSRGLESIFLIAVLLPFLAAGARRLNDCGKNPWWLLFLLVPVGGIVLLGIYWAQPATNAQPEDALPG